jgi:hypothetical protein
MDPLIGKTDLLFDRNPIANSRSGRIKSREHSQSLDGKDFADFLRGSSYQIDSELFALVSILDPMEVSDTEFLSAGKQFNDEDFVRAIYKAYLKREPGTSELRFWTTEIKIQKGVRSSFLRKIRNTLEFTLVSATSKTSKKIDSPAKLIFKYLFPAIKIIRKCCGIQSLEILASIDQVLGQTEFIVGECIDKPKTGDKINTSSYRISGWLIWKNVRPTIRLISNETVIQEVSIQIPRPDVTKARCIESKTHDWGFNILLNVKELPEQGSLELQANFPNGEVVKFGLINFIKY